MRVVALDVDVLEVERVDLPDRRVEPQLGQRPRFTGELETGLLEVKPGQLGPASDWIRTTDIARIDGDGFLWILGRADQAIIRGGFKVHPEDVAKTLMEHPAVREAAVVGVPDVRLGSVPAAAIILKAGLAAPPLEKLESWLRERLLPYQLPVYLRFVADFPRTPSMKPSAPGLQALFTEVAE